MGPRGPHLAMHAKTRWPLRAAKRGPWFSGEKAIFFVSYFIHLDAAAANAGHFYSRHWEGIPRLLHQSGYRLTGSSISCKAPSCPTRERR